jgi:hypothetical protein
MPEPLPECRSCQRQLHVLVHRCLGRVTIRLLAVRFDLSTRATEAGPLVLAGDLTHAVPPCMALEVQPISWYGHAQGCGLLCVYLPVGSCMSFCKFWPPRRAMGRHHPKKQPPEEQVQVGISWLGDALVQLACSIPFQQRVASVRFHIQPQRRTARWLLPDNKVKSAGCIWSNLVCLPEASGQYTQQNGLTGSRKQR